MAAQSPGCRSNGTFSLAGGWFSSLLCPGWLQACNGSKGALLCNGIEDDIPSLKGCPQSQQRGWSSRLVHTCCSPLNPGNVPKLSRAPVPVGACPDSGGARLPATAVGTDGQEKLNRESK